jgi:hypothetical protein
LPVTDPRRFFDDLSIELPAADAERLASTAPRPAPRSTSRFAPLPIRRTPLRTCGRRSLIHARRGAQVINQAPGTELRARLFPGAYAAAASAA